MATARKRSGKRTIGRDGKVSVHGKRANGTGSVYFDAQRDRWCASHTIEGTNRKIRVFRETQEAALSALDARLSDEKAKIAPSTGSTTVRAYSARWLAKVTPGLEPTSVGRYRQRIRRINEHLGDVALAELSEDHVVAALAAMNSTLAATTVNATRSVLAAMTKAAVKAGLMPRDPCLGVRGAKVPRVQRRVLSAAEIRSLVAQADEDRLGAAVVLLFTVGLRASEVLGLRWTDVDLDAGTATVAQASKYLEGTGMILGETKTAGARGVHRLPAVAVTALRAHRKRQAAERLAAGPAWSDEHAGLVFRNINGGLVLRQSLTKAVQRMAVAAELDPTGLGTHGGRRSLITAMFVAGEDIEDIAHHVGHANVSTTRGYVQDRGERPRATADAVDRLLAL